MKIQIRNDSVLIEGYVNAVERNSKPLMSRLGRFIERICKGAFKRAISRNDDIHVLLNHDWDRDLGSTKQGNLELTEDNIGLHARAVITDAEVVEKARHGDLVGWSFGFDDVPDGVESGMEGNMPLRIVRDLQLYEVSILDRAKTPAYDGTLIMARSDDDVTLFGEAFLDDITVEERAEPEETEETAPEESREEQEPQQEDKPVAIDYSKFDEMIAEMKGE